MPGRTTASGSYRYGFNGKEQDNEAKGTGNQQDYGMRIYDPRIGKFLSVDPLTSSYPWYTPYQFAGNKPIYALDLDGAEELPYLEQYQYDGSWGVFDRLKAIPNAATRVYNQGVAGGWNSGVANVRSLSRGTWTQDMRNELKQIGSAVKEDVAEAYGYHINTSVTQQVKDFGRYLADPERGEDVLLFGFSVYTGNKFGSFKNNLLSKNSAAQISSSTSKSIQLIQNKLPVSTNGKLFGGIANGKVKMLGNTKPNGTFDFVVTQKGEVLLGRKHSFLSGGRDVQAAGEIQLRNGQISAVNNASGHYVPNLQESRNFLKILQNQGVDINKAHLNIYGENGRLLEHIAPNARNRSNYVNK